MDSWVVAEAGVSQEAHATQVDKACFTFANHSTEVAGLETHAGRWFWPLTRKQRPSWENFTV